MKYIDFLLDYSGYAAVMLIVVVVTLVIMLFMLLKPKAVHLRNRMSAEKNIKRRDRKNMTAELNDMEKGIVEANLYIVASYVECFEDNRSIITDRKKLRFASSRLRECYSLLPVNAGQIDAYNRLRKIVNDSRKRQFVGSKTAIILGVIFSVAAAYVLGPEISAIVFTVTLFYFISCFRPNRRIFADYANHKDGKFTFTSIIVKVLLIIGAACASTEYVVKYSNGDVKTEGSVLGLIIGLLCYGLTICIMVPAGLVNFIINYVIK